ncbi:putative DNA (cytosine-5-)-methyltransferase [Medicago truncatula]|uniref:Putative DNA (Cytosine-5-)-methyltransferase n=1 Tax=Medicago truncatula TaxID=3880 RepID=A0A396HWF2_MEDTR|nr:putative DNA (cytosine-5-)-methyltransferase [Medicago truncatula]
MSTGLCQWRILSGSDIVTKWVVDLNKDACQSLKLNHPETEETGPGLYIKVSWKGYNYDKDIWEPINGLSNCKEMIKDFVTRGFKSSILPLSGHVDVACGGPPC